MRFIMQEKKSKERTNIHDSFFSFCFVVGIMTKGDKHGEEQEKY